MQADLERMTFQELYEKESRGDKAHRRSGQKRENKTNSEGPQEAKKAHVSNLEHRSSSNSVPTSGERYEELDMVGS